MASGLVQRQDAIVTNDDTAHRTGHKQACTPESELIRRIVATRAFSRSAFLTRFLLYVCDRKLSGREDEITEYRIGVQALGRPKTYNPAEDNIVRNYARILRKRLEEYFAGEGQNEPLRLVIPVGHYVPVFSAHPSATDVPPAEVEDRAAEPSIPGSPRLPEGMKAESWRIRRSLWLPALGLLAAGLGVSIYSFGHAQSDRLYDVFWRQLFDHTRTTYLVPGDTGLTMLQDITGKEVHLNDYVSGDLVEKFPDFNLTAARKGARFGPERFSSYTSTADLSIALGVAGLARHYNGQLLVRYARDMGMQDFKGSNVILLGGPHANPWDELFEPESNFRMFFPMHLDGMHIDQRSFINKHPRPGEQLSYANQTADSSRVGYTLISFLPGVDGRSYVLLLEGQNMPGTQAAGDFLMDSPAMEPVLKQAQLPDGAIGPFEILLEERTVGANAAQPRVVVGRFGINKNSD